jgi:pSer/pThr/pTyr-binding forkhead associated (FHA) protein
LTHFRIRVGNEEIALPIGVTLIGRDATCRVTIFDSLISRRHARIQCDGQHAAIEDLGSRNGTRVNGVLIDGPHAIREGDRISIGSSELVVAVVDPEDSGIGDTPTGIINICPQCQTPFANTTLNCPRCGSTRVTAPAPAAKQKRRDEASGGRWSLGMLLELLGKSILTGSASEAEKLMRQAAIIVSDHLRDARPLDPDELRALGEATAWLAKAQKSDAWQEWMASVHGQMRKTIRPPPAP